MPITPPPYSLSFSLSLPYWISLSLLLSLSLSLSCCVCVSLSLFPSYCISLSLFPSNCVSLSLFPLLLCISLSSVFISFYFLLSLSLPISHSLSHSPNIFLSLFLSLYLLLRIYRRFVLVWFLIHDKKVKIKNNLLYFKARLEVFEWKNTIREIKIELVWVLKVVFKEHLTNKNNDLIFLNAFCIKCIFSILKDKVISCEIRPIAASYPPLIQKLRFIISFLFFPFLKANKQYNWLEIGQQIH